MRYLQVLVLLIVFSLELTILSYDYNLIVIGGGAAGLTAAVNASHYDKRIALIEKTRIGGNRIWAGDIPTKALIRIARLTYMHNSLENLCISKQFHTPHLDNKKILEYIRGITKSVADIHSEDTLKDMGIDIIFGAPYFIDNHTIELNGKTLSADKFIIATGSSSCIPPLMGIEEVPYLIPENFFNQNDLTASMIILGGGPLGTELAGALNRLGIKVTLIMSHGLLLPTFDFELVDHLTNILEKEGVNISCSTRMIKADKTEYGIQVTCLDRYHSTITYEAESLFIATNRHPNVSNLGLENTDVTYSPTGIITSDTMQTNASNIYACGDVVGTFALSRVAYYQAKIAAFNVFCPFWKSKKSVNYTDAAKGLFTYPHFASTGLTEQEARKIYGNQLRIYRVSYQELDRAHIDNATEGIGKFICDAKGYLVGAHILGAHSGELVDLVHIGHRFDLLFEDYLAQLSTSPSYKDLIWLATEKCRKDLRR